MSSPNGVIEIQILDLPEPTIEPWEVPIDVVPVQSENEFLFHKTTMREIYDEARNRFPDSPDVLLWNERGELTETTTGNLVIEMEGQLFTPPVICGLLPGTFRRQLIEEGAITENVIHRSDLDRTSAIWMINSLRGWVPLRFNQKITPVNLEQTPERVYEI